MNQTELDQLIRGGEVKQCLHLGYSLLFERFNISGSIQLIKDFLTFAREMKLASPTAASAVVRITAGEAMHEEYSECEKEFKDALESGVLIEVAAGPILSGRERQSMMIRLAQNYHNTFHFFHAEPRPEGHWKVFKLNGEPKLLQIERPHPPVPEDECPCLKCTITEKEYKFGRLNGHIPDSESDKIMLARAFKELSMGYWADFQRTFVERHRKRSNQKLKEIPVRSTEEIRKLHSYVASRGGTFDVYSTKRLLEIEKLLPVEPQLAA